MAPSTDYHPLPNPGCYFRLLTIQQNINTSSDDGSRFFCSIDVKPLDEDAATPEYVALSYTWGAPLDTPECEEAYREPVRITVSHDNGPQRIMKIGRNLFEALLEIHTNHWQSYVWADAICIDQENLAERSEQVAQMDKVFSRSKHTISWIGAAGSDKDDVLWLYGPFARFLRTWRSDQVEPSEETERMYPALSGRFIDEATSLGGSNQVTALGFVGTEMTISYPRLVALAKHLRECRYFWRSWVLQEVILSSDVILLMGSHVLSTEAHLEMSLWFTSDSIALSIISEREGIRYNVHAFGDVVGLWKTICEMDASSLKLMMKAWGATCPATRSLAILAYLVALKVFLGLSDPRDHFYSVLGVVRSLAPSPFIDSFRPNYESSVQEVFIEFATKLITDLPYMRLFQLLPCYHKRRLEDLPSWVPDFSSTDPKPGLTGVSRPFLGSFGDDSFDVFRFRDEITGAVEISGVELHLHAAYCGDIVDQAAFSDRTLEMGDQIILGARFYLLLLKFAHTTGPEYINGQPILWAILQTILLGFKLDACEQLKSTVEAFRTTVMAHVSILRKSLMENPEKVEEKRILDDICNNFEPMSGQYGLVNLSEFEAIGEGLGLSSSFRSALDFEANVSAVLSMKNVFRTGNGYLGLCSLGTQTGDQLWILCPAKTPQILRPLPEEGKYLIMGEAYVHGAMHGEFVERGVAKTPHKITIV